MKIIKLTNHNQYVLVNCAHIKLIMPIADQDWPACHSLVDLIDDTQIYAHETPEEIMKEIIG